MSKTIEAILGCEEEKPDTVIHRAEEVELHLPLASTPYPAPNPTVLILSGLLTTAIAARTAYNNGDCTEADRSAYVGENGAIPKLFVAVKQICAYCNNTTPNDEVNLALTGYPLSNQPHKLDLLNPPRNLHRFVRENIAADSVKLGCKKPSNAAEGQKVFYKFFRSLTPDFASAVCIAERSKTTHTDHPAVLVATVFYYFVTALSPAGESAPSDVCKVVIVPNTL